MPAPNPSARIEPIRQFAAARAAALSVNRVAQEIGLTARGFQKFLDGSEPQTGTRQKLERWYLRARVEAGGETDAETARTALAVLLHDLPPGRREAALLRILRLWEEEYDGAGVPRPAWLTSLRERPPE
jgi:hypothetical protein